jgi:hypothetical protein
VENPLSQNESSVAAMALPDPYRSKIQVVNTSLTGMAGNFTAAAAGMCAMEDGAPDAVYAFSPSINTRLRFTVDMPPGTSSSLPVIALYDAAPSSSPTVTALNNQNEGTESAHIVDLALGPQQYSGNTAAMSDDIDGALMGCFADPASRDAVFKFSLAQPAEIEIDASASTMTDPVIAVFNDFALEQPAGVVLENDSFSDASDNPDPTPIATSNWLVYNADMANLTAASQAQVMYASDNTNEVVDPGSLTGALARGDVWTPRVTVNGGNTANKDGMGTPRAAD